MDISIRSAGPVLEVRLSGTLDAKAASTAYGTIVGIAASRFSQVHLDLGDLEGASRAACRAIFVAAKLLQTHGGRMRITGARPEVLRILRNAGFDAVITFDAASADAAASHTPCAAVRRVA